MSRIRATAAARGRLWWWIAVAAVCGLCITASGEESADGDAAQARTGRRDVHSIAWLPEAFTDYLTTGQTPRPGVARIVAPDAGGTSVGSGVLVDANASQALVLTNAHVVRECRGAVLVQFADGFQSAGTVLRKDDAWDLAAIVIWRPEILPLPIAQALPAPGEPLTIAGYGRGPYREQTGPCTQYLSPGSGLPNELVELAATARQGDSGGPILNGRGEVAGILFGEGSGRTVGACASRVRAFLWEIGSAGFDRTGINAITSGPSAAPSFATMPPLAGAGDAGPTPGPVVASFAPHQPATMPQASPPVTAMPGSPAGAGRSGWPIELPADPAEAAKLALSAAGAVSLVLMGLRALFARPAQS